ncbi:cupin domain-containing protein [Novosphingobium sp. 1949]|uniref:Cupin domain-containing protein n=1 Tax=Novosphingobium organovorum TaxID=2930092 RepID=A0ABT0BFD3_9SPHN|nr:cupin domain-containing protein [Novosphingobium organovorum]MCJ2183752.1 cupin domain-containing protein [Novosphingobium organovorum]
MPLQRDPHAAVLIERLDLAPHPEGGWYRQIWRAPEDASGRPAATSIHFLLEAHQTSHWHRVVDAQELWMWHAGSPLVLSRSSDAATPASEALLGPDVLAGQSPQLCVPSGAWQASRPVLDDGPGWTLVSCVVVPGFDFSRFELAPPGWAPGA